VGEQWRDRRLERGGAKRLSAEQEESGKGESLSSGPTHGNHRGHSRADSREAVNFFNANLYILALWGAQKLWPQ